MVEMELSKIIIDEKRPDQIIVLKEKNGPRLMPIVIGYLEANAIKLKVSGVTPPRPLTHDLLFSVIEGLGASVGKVLIDRLENNTFYAKLVLQISGQASEKAIDARPSDAIAMAVRAHAPIFVDEEVIKRSEVFHQQP
ncbi:MAG: bifunctional nuclease family protein [Candidatus Omnitrophota bacterium]|jgi:bifunctional DNase/RNase|nr:bifunctional nuclease family protein [Candidatus Omnitrophota bacterium]MDD5538611.1 bifunctional nuclease family protein [Candidatus Omnitrophota bacterium]